jgi:ribonuclease PH
MDGNFTQEEFEEAFKLAIHGCEKVYEVQKEALRKKYGG